MRKTWIFGSLIALAAGAATLHNLASGPDRQLHFERRVGSPLTPTQLDAYLGNVDLWPDWFYSTASARITNAPTRKRIQTGDRVSITVDPKKGEWKKFEILMEVTHYEPGKSLAIRVIEDSKGRLRTLFNDLNWEVDLEPTSTDAHHATIIGRASGMTHHWRSRLFGVLTERILMAQVFYPNVIALSEKGAGVEPAGGGLFPN